MALTEAQLGELARVEKVAKPSRYALGVLDALAWLTDDDQEQARIDQARKKGTT